jgi:hypothetical protein
VPRLDPVAVIVLKRVVAVAAAFPERHDRHNHRNRPTQKAEGHAYRPHIWKRLQLVHTGMGDFGGLRRRWAMKLLSARAADACRSWLYFHVLDVFGWPIGPLSFLWPHEGTDRVQFLAVRPAWAPAQDLLVPAQGVQVAPTYGLVCVPYPREVLYEAPRQPAGLPLPLERAREAYDHYRVRVATFPAPNALRQAPPCPLGIRSEAMSGARQGRATLMAWPGGSKVRLKTKLPRSPLLLRAD